LEQLPPLDLDAAAAELSRRLIELLQDGTKRQNMGKNAMAVVEANRGSTLKTIGLLKTLINATSSKNEKQDSVLASNAS
jgi:hypothetical protein